MSEKQTDHARGCQGREYTCTCGYDDQREWQDISTAPKNWTDVLLYDPEYRNDHRNVFEGYYEPELEIWLDSRGEPVSPTHFQPLPSPPKPLPTPSIQVAE